MKRIGTYRLHEEVGRGSTGVVYRAFDEACGAVVAIKLLDEGAAEDPLARTRFARECELVGAFAHPGLVRLRGAGATEEGMDYLVMDLAEGISLKTRLKRGPRLGLEESAVLVSAASDAVTAMHDVGWAHRDIKPANLVLDARNQPRLLDFGLAARFGAKSEARLTQAGFFVGTPLYLAPEQLLGAPPAATMDVYALAAVLYELLTGRPPFTGPTEALLAAKSSRDAPEYGGPPAVRALLRAALARDAGLRPRDAGDFAAELRSAVSPAENARPWGAGDPSPCVSGLEAETVSSRPSHSSSSAGSSVPALVLPPPPPGSGPSRERVAVLIEELMDVYAPPPPRAVPGRSWLYTVVAALVFALTLVVAASGVGLAARALAALGAVH